MDKKEVQVNLEPVAKEFLENADLNVEAFKGKILNVVREKAPEEYANFSQQMEAMTGFIKDVYLLSFHTFFEHAEEESTQTGKWGKSSN